MPYHPPGLPRLTGAGRWTGLRCNPSPRGTSGPPAARREATMNAPRRISGPLAALGGAAIVVGLLVQPTPAGAAETPDPTLSAWGTARIDGVLGAGEWDGAARIDFAMKIPAHDGGGTVPASLYVMNDALNLYVAVKAPGFYDAFNPVFEFDNDHDGIRFVEGDDGFGSSASWSSFLELPPGPKWFGDTFRVHCPGQTDAPAHSLCGFADTYAGEGYPAPGTIDGAAAGFSSSTRKSSFMEMSHPLDSGDDAHDFSLRHGDVVGFFLSLRVISTAVGPECGYPECFGDTMVPANALAGRAIHLRVAIPASTPTPTPTPAAVSSSSWTAAISGAGVSGRASLTVPATGRATAAFSLYHLKKGVSVAARIVAGAACSASATTISKAPGYTTTVGGTWRQRWAFAGAGLVRLRSAIRSGTPLWFDVKVGGSRVCTRLAGGDEITGKGMRGSVAFAFRVALPQSGKVVGRFDSTLMSSSGVQIRGAVDCGWVKGKIGVLGGLMDGANPASPNSYFMVMVSDGPDGIIIGTGRPRCGIDGFGDPRSLPISSGEIVVIDR